MFQVLNFYKTEKSGQELLNSNMTIEIYASIDRALGAGVMTTDEDFWGLIKIIGTRDKIIDVIHHLSPKVPIIFSENVEISLKYWCKVIPKQTAESIFILLPTILETNGDKWGLMETFGD